MVSINPKYDNDVKCAELSSVICDMKLDLYDLLKSTKYMSIMAYLSKSVRLFMLEY